MIRILKLILLIAVFVLGATFAVTNKDPVTLDYLFGTIDVSLGWVPIAGMVVGFVLAIFGSLAQIVAARAENRRLRKSLKDAETELKNLRHLPIKDV